MIELLIFPTLILAIIIFYKLKAKEQKALLDRWYCKFYDVVTKYTVIFRLQDNMDALNIQSNNLVQSTYSDYLLQGNITKKQFNTNIKLKVFHINCLILTP